MLKGRAPVVAGDLICRFVCCYTLMSVYLYRLTSEYNNIQASFNILISGSGKLMAVCAARSWRWTTRSMISATANTISITRPDDFHLHLRDGDGLRSVARLSADIFKRAIIMPNLKQPVVRTAQVCADVHAVALQRYEYDIKKSTVDGTCTFLQALEYKRAIKEALPENSGFEPLMTLYLTDKTEPEEVHAAKDAGIVAFKLYPAGATTNSDSGVTDVTRCLPTLNAMAEVCPYPWPALYCVRLWASLHFIFA